MGESQNDGSHSPSEDAALVRLVLRGERRAMARLAERLVCVPRMLANFDRRRGGILGDAELEDLSQDTVLRIWRKLATFPPYATLEMWSYRFCQFEYLNRLRRVERRVRLESVSETPPEQEVSDPEPDSIDWSTCLEAALDGLGEADAALIRMKHFEARTFEEVAESFDIPVNTAKARYYRGLAKLRERLERGLPAGELL